MKAYIEQLKQFRDSVQGAWVCSETVHAWESDKPDKDDTCKCGRFYFRGAKLDADRGQTEADIEALKRSDPAQMLRALVDAIKG